MFLTEEEAKSGMKTLKNAAIENGGFLSANMFEKIVHEKETTYDPRLGWSLEMLENARFFKHHHFHIVEIKGEKIFEEVK
jgi:hypothetical protein